MDHEQMIQKASDIAEETLELKAEALRKRGPSLTKEMAFQQGFLRAGKLASSSRRAGEKWFRPIHG